MTDLTRDEILAAVREGEPLSGANLSGANLYRAYLYRANLYRANLSGADLSGAYLTWATLPTGERWEEYLHGVVPALCAAGGVPLTEVARHWTCHNWSNCPMSAAFQAESISGVPILLRPRVDQFIQFFDANLIDVVVDGETVTFAPTVLDETPSSTASAPDRE